MVAIDGIIFSLQQAGGISTYFSTLLRYLSKQNIPTSLFLENPLLQKIEKYSYNIIPTNRKARYIERFRRCRLVENTSVFHSSYYRTPDNGNIPIVVTVYDFIYERFRRGLHQKVHTLQKYKAIRSAHSIICISESTKNDLLYFVGKTPGQTIHVIHCGVSETFHSLSIEQSSSPFVLFVGQRDGYKNFRLALESMVLLPELEMYCVGGGLIRPDELKNVSESVSKRVRYLGFVTDEELNILYNRALCLLYPSSYEGFGIPVLEAMRAGCPVVCTDCKAVHEVGRDALIVVSSLDPRLMAGAIMKTASSDRHNIIQKGFAVAQDYSWDITHRQTLEIYRNLGA